MKYQHCTECGEEFEDLTNTGLLDPSLCAECFNNKYVIVLDDLEEKHKSNSEKLAYWYNKIFGVNKGD